MSNEIKLLRNNENRTDSDLDKINELYKFLQGEIPEGIHLVRGHVPNFSEKKAFAVIWFLQEHLSIFPDRIERCDSCGDLFDTHCEGIHWESKGKNYCGGCDWKVPQNYDNNQR